MRRLRSLHSDFRIPNSDFEAALHWLLCNGSHQTLPYPVLDKRPRLDYQQLLVLAALKAAYALGRSGH